MLIVDFKTNGCCDNWHILDDVVMGGKSNGNFKLDAQGYGVFEGNVSTENNGGFSMVQYSFETKKVTNLTKISMRLKGDGKSYQFRIKSNVKDSYSYVFSFETAGKWEIIEIPFNSMYPAFRGRKLNAPNYPGNQMERIAFLIGNKKPESFKLIVDTIVLE